MKLTRILMVLIIVFFYNDIHAQKRHKNYNRKDFQYFSFGPEIGGSGYIAILEGREGKIYAEYSLGGKIIVQPTEQFRIHTGFKYHKAIKNYHYYSSPLTLKYSIIDTNNQKITVLGGINFNFNAINDRIDFNNPNFGWHTGVGVGNTYVIIRYNQKMPIFKDIPLSDIKYMIGFGLEMSLLFGFL
jgi:hypothetical protein